MFTCSVYPYNTQDTASFCVLRNCPQEVQKIISAGRAEGLRETTSLSHLLTQGNYIPVLKAIWSERDRARRLVWLREKTELHAPLMFEQAIAEFVNFPSARTIHLVSIPLIEAAKFRVQQDCQCSQDFHISNGDMHEFMATTYLNSLERASQKYLHQSVDLSGSFEGEYLAILNMKIKTIRQSTLSRLPDPEWTKWHSPNALFWNMPMRCSFEWKPLRDAFAKHVEAQLAEIIYPAALVCLCLPQKHTN